MSNELTHSKLVAIGGERFFSTHTNHAPLSEVIASKTTVAVIERTASSFGNQAEIILVDPAARSGTIYVWFRSGKC
jgi:hypothetical protein